MLQGKCFREVENTVFDNERFNTNKKACFKHCDKDVYFLVSSRGDAIEVHIAAVGREAKLSLRCVGRQFIDWVPVKFPWAKMLIAPVKSRAVYNFCVNIGFTDCGVIDYGRDKSRVMVINYGWNNR